ncbi:MAG: GtrA family protein [Oscillospiraceae bacterium]|nr:GtrA family protein [Oscillospiraceae bacterium]
MIEKIKELCIKYREILVYLIVGVLTTVVAWGAKFLWNFLFYAGTAHPTHLQNLILSCVNWIAGVAFAYPMNRHWVFQSKNPDILKEASGFVASRIATWIMDILVMQLLGNVLGINLYVATVISGILVVIGNYVFSKLLVFRKKNTDA